MSARLIGIGTPGLETCLGKRARDNLRARVRDKDVVLTGDPASFMRDVDEIEKVTAADVKRVITKYFAADKATIVVIPPKGR